MATPVVRALRENYPNAQIDLLTFPKGAKDVIEGGNEINNVYLYSNRNNTLTREKPSIIETIRNSFLLLLKLRFKRYNLSVSVFPSASNSLGFLAKLIGAKRRIGFNSKYYTDIIEGNFKDHKVEQNLRLLKPLGIKVKNKKQYFNTTRDNEMFAEEFLKKNKAGKKLLVGMHPGSWWKASLKKWPLENYIKLSDKIIEKYNSKILVICGPSEEQIGKELKEKVKKSENVIISEKQNLKDAAAIIGKCSLFISSDSGMMHVAEAMKVPLIVIPGYTRFKFSGPYEKKNIENLVWKKTKCYEKCPVLYDFDEEFEGREDQIPCNVACYNNIKPSEVFSVVEKILKKK